MAHPVEAIPVAPVGDLLVDRVAAAEEDVPEVMVTDPAAYDAAVSTAKKGADAAAAARAAAAAAAADAAVANKPAAVVAFSEAWGGRFASFLQYVKENYQQTAGVLVDALYAALGVGVDGLNKLGLTRETLIGLVEAVKEDVSHTAVVSAQAAAVTAQSAVVSAQAYLADSLAAAGGQVRCLWNVLAGALIVAPAGQPQPPVVAPAANNGSQSSSAATPVPTKASAVPQRPVRPQSFANRNPGLIGFLVWLAVFAAFALVAGLTGGLGAIPLSVALSVFLGIGAVVSFFAGAIANSKAQSTIIPESAEQQPQGEDRQPVVFVQTVTVPEALRAVAQPNPAGSQPAAPETQVAATAADAPLAVPLSRSRRMSAA